MSARMVSLLGETDDVQAQAGDQLYVDMDLSHDNLPAGTRIALGEDAVLEVTAKPHAGCKKFLARFGEDALAFVNGEVGSRMRLRGLNARVVRGGVIRPGDVVRRLGDDAVESDPTRPAWPAQPAATSAVSATIMTLRVRTRPSMPDGLSRGDGEAQSSRRPE